MSIEEDAKLEKQVFEGHRVAYNEARTRFCYFLITAAGVSLAYGLQMLKDASPSGLNVLGHLALVTWLLSIAGGLYWQSLTIKVSRADLGISRAKFDGISSEMIDELHSRMERLSCRARWCQSLQWWALALGAMLFVGYHFTAFAAM